MPKNNRIVVDLAKVQWANYYYRNQHGETRPIKPYDPTVYGQKVSHTERAMWHPDYPQELAIDRAKRLGLIDVWTPELKLKLTASEYLIYTGAKASSIYKEWNARIFGKRKK